MKRDGDFIIFGEGNAIRISEICAIYKDTEKDRTFIMFSGLSYETKFSTDESIEDILNIIKGKK